MVAAEGANTRDTRIPGQQPPPQQRRHRRRPAGLRHLVEANTRVDNTGASVETAGVRTVIRSSTMDSTWTGAFADYGVRVAPGARDTRVEANAIARFAFLGIEDIGRGSVTALNVLDGQLDPDTWTGIFGGITVQAGARQAQVQGNTVRRLAGGGITVAGDDGLDADSPSTTITANVANDNADYGVEAVPGVTDGGGNRASGNGQPAQCLGVVCA